MTLPQGVVAVFRGELNPVVVRELRQSVRSRFLVGIVVLFSLLLLVVTGAVLLSGSASPGEALGERVFYTVLAVLGGACAIVPLYVGKRLVEERTNAGLDLLYITTLGPDAIVRGKFLAGLVLMLLLSSLALPFLVFSYLLRGIDFLTMFAALGWLLAGMVAWLGVAVLGACLPMSPVFRGVALVGLVVFGPMAGGSAGMGLSRSFAGVSAGGGAGMRFTVAVVALLLFTVVLLLLRLAVLLISPVTANRLLPVRLTIAVLWLLWGGIAALMSGLTASDTVLLVWYGASSVVLSLSLLASVSETERLSLRVQRAIPRSVWRRLWVFPVFSGPVNGFVWAVLLMLISGVVTFALLPSCRGGGSETEAYLGFGLIFLYAMCYALTGGLLQRLLFRKRSAKVMAWLLAVYVLTAGMFVPLLWQAMGRRLHSEWLRELRFGSVFQVFGSVEDQFRELPLVLLWLAGVGLASLPWALRQVRAFRPPPVPTAPDAIPEPAADLPPPPPSP